MEKQERKTKQWMAIVDLRSRGLTFAQIAALTGVSRQRAHEIIGLARKYAAKHDDDLTRYIAERMQPQ